MLRDIFVGVPKLGSDKSRLSGEHPEVVMLENSESLVALVRDSVVCVVCLQNLVRIPRGEGAIFYLQFTRRRIGPTHSSINESSCFLLEIEHGVFYFDLVIAS